MTHLFFRLFFFYRVAVSEEKTELFLNFFLKNNLKTWDYNRADGIFSFSVDRRGYHLAKDHGEQVRVPFLSVSAHGLFPHLFEKRARGGLLIGGLLAVFFFLFTAGLVWDIRITGGEKMTDAEIREELAASGLSLGTPIASFDREAFSAALLSDSEKISFIGVNFQGSVAYVQIMERKDPEKIPLPSGGANLIAAQDAVIDGLSVVRGEICVGRGDVVRAGDLLVGGVTEGAGVSRFVYAAGEVYGRVEHTLSVTVPRVGRKIIETKHKTTGISLKMFGKSINIYQSTGNLPPIYDTIYREIPLQGFGGKTLPFAIELAYAEISTYEEEILSDAEAVRRAEQLLEGELSGFLADKTLLQKSLVGTFDGNHYTLTAKLLTRENIAVTQEFSLAGEK